MGTDICLPVLKFSYATGVRSDNTIPWVHVTASDVFVVVKDAKQGFEDSALRMRIVQATTVLVGLEIRFDEESLDVSRYVDAAIEARRKSEEAGVRPQVEQLPIFGITKESLLAIRYRQEDGQARRLQLRMGNAAECRQVVHVFERRGMEFQEQRPRTARPGTARPDTAASQSRPLTVQSSSPYFEPPAPPAARPNPFTMPPVEAGSLSQIRTPSPERRPIRGHGSRRETGIPSHEMLPPRLFSRDEAAAPREISPTRPTTAQIYRSYTTPSQPSQYDTYDLAGQAAHHPAERPSSTSNMASLEAIRQAVAGHDAEFHATAVQSEAHPSVPSRSNEHWSSASAATINPALLSSDPAEPRPATARLSTPYTIPVLDTLEHEIPPRRELPFPRPDSRRSGSENNSSRPATATMPPLQKPKLVKSGSASPTKSSSASPSKQVSPARPTTASPLKAKVNEDGAEYSTQVPNNNDTAAQVSTTSTTSPARLKSPTFPVKRPSPMDELLARKKPLTERSTNTGIPRVNSLADAPHEIDSPPSTALPPKDSFVATRKDYTTAIRSTMQRAETSNLNDYAAQSREDREATIDEFMVENLENSSFTKLCEDVENCWRRIALGL